MIFPQTSDLDFLPLSLTFTTHKLAKSRLKERRQTRSDYQLHRTLHSLSPYISAHGLAQAQNLELRLAQLWVMTYWRQRTWYELVKICLGSVHSTSVFIFYWFWCFYFFERGVFRNIWLLMIREENGEKIIDTYLTHIESWLFGYSEHWTEIWLFCIQLLPEGLRVIGGSG
jgi:hypothetical protein